jgi:hypothetical protein
VSVSCSRNPSVASFAGSKIRWRFNPKLAEPRMGLDSSASFAGSVNGAFEVIRDLSEDRFQSDKNFEVHYSFSTYVQLKTAICWKDRRG